MKKVFCEKCNEFMDYSIEERTNEFEIRGKKYKYLEKIAICNNCGEQVTVNELVDENLKRLNYAYRKQENIITVDEIVKILKKYSIGKRPLSRLLGFGEITITRYIDGDMPTRAYSDELYRVLNDSNYMLDILEKNKNNISDRAYNLVKKSIENNTYVNQVSKDLELVSNYIIIKGEDITPLALQKLLYYSQGFFFAFFSKYLFNDDCQAWVHGPVYPEIYHEYKKNGCNPIVDINDNDIDIDNIIDSDKKTFLDIILNSFGYYSGKALEKMTHLDEPWYLNREDLLIDECGKKIIQKEQIADFFVKIKEKYNMLIITDIKKYSDEQFKNILLYN